MTTHRLQAQDVALLYDPLCLALCYMSQGFIIFDAHERMILCNDQWRILFGVDSTASSPGISLVDLIKNILLAADADSSDTVLSEARNCHLAKIAGSGTSEEITYGGRTLLLQHRPIPQSGGWVTTVDDITQRRQIEERVAYLARYDLLTGLPNRAFIYEAISRAERELHQHRSCALLCIGLDHFKQVNDTFGHAMGDAVLRTIADRILGQLCSDHVAVRLGSDEFAVVATDFGDPDAALSLASSLIQLLGKPIALDRGVVHVEASIGITLMPTTDWNADLLLHQVDLALRRAKATGRNKTTIYDPSLDALLQDQRQLEHELRQSLKNEDFEVVYQPIVNLQEQVVIGFEALLRWTSITRGSVPPSDFIPFLEQTGLMPDIDEWVLRRACSVASTWPSNLTVAVNLSPTSFKRAGLTRRIAAILNETGLPFNRLELEITETTAIGNLDTINADLRELRNLGIQIALDDFGTGHSSLSLARTLPFTRIKIDRSFVQDMENNPHATVIVRAVCGICKGLGVRATAEGVETSRQAMRLIVEGCTDLQGYLISRPIRAEALLDWLQQVSISSMVGAE